MKKTIIFIVIILLLIAGCVYYSCMQREKFEQEKKEAVAEAVQHAIDSLKLCQVLEVPKQEVTAHKPPPPPPPKAKKEPAEVPVEPDMLTDERDGQQYNIFEVDGDWWMGENLNFPTQESWCYDVQESNCDKWGRLYTWKEATTSCPQGWHLPDDQEWSKLINYYGGVHYAGKSFKVGGSSPFNAFMAGYYYHEGSFGKVDVSAYFWSATEQNNDYASFKGVYSTVDNVGTYTYIKIDGMSVRCVKDRR